MCQAMTGAGRFDPSLCPLLQHLTPEEQLERIRTDLSIAACIGALASADLASTQVSDAKLERRLDAYRSRCQVAVAAGAGACGMGGAAG